MRFAAGLLAFVFSFSAFCFSESEIDKKQLPREAIETIALIRTGGPYPYERDGAVFGNREKRLPARERGWYREYTVRTPGERTRGARRIVAGRDGTLYYTDDHYRSFKRVLEQTLSKLLQRLRDASKSGVYRASRTDEILDATRGDALRVARVDLAGIAGKGALLQRFAQALEFPAWFGANWDALEDCLADLSWSKADGHVLLIEAAADLPADERGILIDILASAAASWAERKRPFFAVFLDGSPHLPELYRSSR